MRFALLSGAKNMTIFDEVTERLTLRLRIDPELRMDVSHELRTHLEDAAAEFRGAGQGEEEAAASAVKALGEERELGEMLWQANRRRIRFRQAAKWAARVTLLPGALAVVVLLLTTFLPMSAVVAVFGGFNFGERVPFARVLNTSGLNADQKLILFGDPKAKNQAERLNRPVPTGSGYIFPFVCPISGCRQMP
jgi:hypothetical protein